MAASARFARSVTLLLALTSAVVFGSIGEAACELHGLGGLQVAPAATHRAGVPAHAATHGHQKKDAHGTCCCVSACCVTASVATTPTLPTLIVAAIVAQPSHLFEAPTALSAPIAPDRLLPFANGPPAALL